MLENDDLVVLDDGDESVCDGHDGGVLEGVLDKILDDRVGLLVDVSGGFVHKQDLWFFDESSSDADELSLSDGEIASSGVELEGELVLVGYSFVLDSSDVWVVVESNGRSGEVLDSAELVLHFLEVFLFHGLELVLLSLLELEDLLLKDISRADGVQDLNCF